MICKVSLKLILTVCLAASCYALTGNVGKFESGVLPEDVKPTRYDIELDTSTHNGVEDGYTATMIIDVDITDEFDSRPSIMKYFVKNFKDDQPKPFRRDQIVVGASPNMIFDNARYDVIENGLRKYIPIESFVSDHEKMLVAFNLAKTLRPGSRGQITIQFRVHYNTILTGHFGLLRDGDVLLSNFQPLHARHAFPCFDEEKFVTPIELRVIHDGDQTVVSSARMKRTRSLYSDTRRNMKIERLMSIFDPTKPIGFDEFAIAIGPFKTYNQKEVGQSKIEVTVYFLPEMEEQAQKTAQILVKAIENAEREQKVPFPGDKFDLVVVGGRNNYDGSSLGMAAIKLSDHSEEDIARVVAHQFTMKLESLE